MKTKEDLKNEIVTAIQQCTYLEDQKMAELLAGRIGKAIDFWIDLVIEDMAIKKYCIEQAVRTGQPDTLELAKRIEEYIKEKCS